MSKQRVELREMLRKQDVSKPLAIAPQLTFTAPATVNAPGGATESTSVNSAERGSEIDRVQNSPGSNLTGSKFDPLKMETEKSESKFEDLDAPLSKSDPVKFEQAGTGFTQVPHAVLRIAGLFEDPIDFMVYLHLFTFSWGFQRETVDMGLTQLERFTGAARNTVRRSLDRLTEKRWITEVQKQEPGRISRKWKVRNPAPKDRDSTGSKTHRVQNEPGQDLTPRGSNPAPVTGSKLNPYKESSKQSFKETLSLGSEEVREYFAKLASRRKRESEWKAFQEIRRNFPEYRISQALERILKGRAACLKEPCHSPMAFLRHAIEQVLLEVDSDQARLLESQERQANEAAQAKARESQERAEQDAIRAKIEAFEIAFPDPVERNAMIQSLTHGCSYLPELSLRAVAAERWAQR